MVREICINVTTGWIDKLIKATLIRLITWKQLETIVFFQMRNAAPRGVKKTVNNRQVQTVV